MTFDINFLMKAVLGAVVLELKLTVALKAQIMSINPSMQKHMKIKLTMTNKKNKNTQIKKARHLKNINKIKP